MYYVIQENLFREKHYEDLIATIKRLGLGHEIVKVLPFIEEYEFNTGRKDVFLFGSTKMARISHKYGFKPGSLLNENHNYEVYSNYYKENLLNYDSRVVEFNSNFEWNENAYFIRPTEDSKTFNGAVFVKNEWYEFTHRMLNNGHTTTLNAKTPIQVSTVKDVQKEYRFWVVGGKIITGSQYKLGRQVIYDNFIEPAAQEFAQRMVDKFQLADAFVIDVCLCNDEWKIVECGCINCAGFYESNLQKLIIALEDFFS